MNTIELVFKVQGAARDILIAQLSEAGCSGFEETDTTLYAYIPDDNETTARVMAAASDAGLPFSQKVIPAQNWNAVWEASFDPVVVPGFCTVRAPFHAAENDTPHEIVIMPKMSFGTGHHATTRLMMQAMQDIDFRNAQVLDYGAGTGILAILAEKLGAASVLAIDIDEWSVSNAKENVAANNAACVKVAHAGIMDLPAGSSFDVVLANINRNVLLESMAALYAGLRPGGTLLLSGILRPDETIISESATSAGFRLCESFNESEWMCLKFTA